MKEFEELLPRERAVLLIWGKELDYSLSKHISIKKINQKIKSVHNEIRDNDIRRINKMLIASNFVIKHPAGRNTTYELSPEGRKCCLILKDENI